MTPDLPLSDHGPQRDEIRDALHQFEQAWLNDSPPDVREYFDAHRHLGVTLLRQLVVLNYDLAWEAFRSNLPDAANPAREPDPVIVYRRAYPETDGDNGLLLELLFLEITNWENPDEEYYVEKYPQLADALRSVFDLLKLFRPEQLRTWVGSVSKMARAQADDSHSLLLDTQLASAERDRPSVDARTETGVEANEPQPPLDDGATIELADSCRIAGDTIGVGAFKRVYQGYQASTGRAVAVKQLMRLTQQGVRNFVSEGRAQAGLDHQNIPPVMLLGDQDGQPALLLEKLIHAPDWSTIIRDSRQRSRNLDILLTVSRAAEYAHRECRLVHRDIKPQNVLVGEYREVYLVDWGLAVQVGDEPVLDESVRQLRHEPDGYIIGPPAYMAPEMAMGRNQKSTPATDVFLLGAILYEVLAGHPPYDAYPRSACMRAAAHLFPDLPDDTPEELKAIALQAMARDPARRFVDAGEFGDALERYLSHQEAENQSNRADSEFRSLCDELNSPAAERRDMPALLTSLIAVADQFRQAGELWQASGRQPGAGQDDDPSAAPTDVPDTESATEFDEFTTAGIDRSRQRECDSREQLVSFAIESGDLALAQSQAEVLSKLNSPRAGELQTAVVRAQERRQRDRRQRLTAATATLILLVASLIFWQQRTSADARADKAESDRVAAESKQQLAEAETQKKAAEVRAAQAELKREEAERLAAAERADRERERAQLAEAQRLFNLAITAQTEDFHQASVLYRAASLAQLPADDADAVHRLLEHGQSALTPHGTSSRRIMTGSVLLSPDGRWLVSTDLLRTSIRVWSTEDWSERLVLDGHQRPSSRAGLWGTVRGLAFDPRDAGVLYSAGMDGTLRVWNLSTGKELRRFEPEPVDGNEPAGHELMSLAVRPARDGDSVELVCGKRSGELLVLNADMLVVIREVQAHKAQVTAVRFRPDGTHLATSASDGTLTIRAASLEELASLRHPEQPDGGDPIPLLDVEWSPDGTLLAASGEAATIPIWETETWTLARILSGHPESVDGSTRVRDLLWLGNDQLLSGGADGVIRRWDLQTGKTTGELTGHTPDMYGRRDILSLTVDPRDSNRLVSSGRDDAIRVWNLTEGSMTHALEGAGVADPQHLIPMPIHSAYATETDQLLTTMPSYDAPARLWNTETLREVQRFPQFPDLGEDDTDRRVQGLAISPDGRRFVTSELNGNLIFWNTTEPAPVKVIKGHDVVSGGAAGPPPSNLIPVAFSPDGMQVISLSSDGRMRLWNSGTGDMISEWDTTDPELPPEIPDFVNTLSEDFRKAFLMQLRQRAMDNTVFFVSEDRIATAGRDGIVRFWDVATGTIVRRLEHVARIRCAALDSTGALLAMGTVNGDVQIHDLSNPDRERVVYAASLDPIMDVSRFGRPLRVAESSRSFAEDFQRRWAMHVHSIAFSPGNDLLAVTLGDGSLTLIQIETGDILGRAIGHNSATGFMQSVEVTFTKNGRLLTIGDDHAIRQWDFNPWKAGRRALAKSASFGGGWQLAAADGGEWVYVAGEELVRWRTEEDPEAVTWKIDGDLVRNVVPIPESDEVLLGTHFGRAIRFSRTDNQPVLTFAGEDGQRMFTRGMGGAKVAVSIDGQLAASSWQNGQVDIWSLADGSLVRTIPGSEQPDTNRAVEAIAFHPAGTQLAVTDFVGTLRIWDLMQPESREPLFERIGPQQAAGLEYMPDGSQLIQAGLEQSSEIIVVWETEQFEKVTALKGHRPVGVFGGGRVSQVLDLDISPDGRWLATCGSDATVRVWQVTIDAEDPAQDVYAPFVVLSTLDLASAIRLVPDDSTDPGNVRTWLTSVAFQSDSRKLAVCGNSGPVYVFDMDTIQRETQRPASALYDHAAQEMGIRLENDRPVAAESLRLMPVTDQPQ